MYDSMSTETPEGAGSGSGLRLSQVRLGAAAADDPADEHLSNSAVAVRLGCSSST